MTKTDKPVLKKAATPQAAASECAQFVLQTLAQALTVRDSATFAISGGATPRLLFADLAASSFNWSRVHVFWVDERCVPPTDSQSNFKLADDSWFRPANFPKANLHRVLGELAAEEGARQYVREIADFFGLNEGGIPVFDVIHRGMGGDAHTASLFPGEPLIQNRSGIAANVWVEKFKMHRVTLLPGVLLAADSTVLQVSGEDKADAVQLVLEGEENWMKYPCQIASRDARAYWFLDTAASAKLGE